ncbi:hypothetical protein IAR55_004690 [Kwoniella newhampshirensis]|uniref:Pantothenate transporter n=1 Tax=Kwoniella newhampshirensis TaxID=1651941 RepID=A0AAW0YVP9_9TREE
MGNDELHTLENNPRPTDHEALLAGPSKKGAWQKFAAFVWDKDYYDKSDAERSLVHKLDCSILTCLAFGYLMKYIDQTNLSNAYVSGMRADLHIKGNEYTYMTVIYNAVYCAMQIPSNLLALKIRPSYMLAACEIGWMTFTFAQAGAKTVNQMYVFRFFIALFESPFQVATIHLMGSWYTKNELAKRISVWFVAGTAGQAFSGFLQAAIFKNMDGLAGLAGWRWLYIICGIMTLPGGIAILMVLPDYPENTKVWFLTEADKQLAKARCAMAGTVASTGIINLSTFKRIFSRWHIWVLGPTYIVYAWSVQSYSYFNTYLLLEGYTVTLRNILPSVAFIIGIPVSMFWGYLSDRTGSRLGLTLGPQLWGLVPTGILCFFPANKAVRLFAFMVDETYFVTHIYFTWVNEICKADAEERAFLIAACNTLFYAFNAWLPTVVFLQTDGPRWKKGFPTLFGANIISCCCMVAIYFLYERQKKQLAAQGEVEPEVEEINHSSTLEEKE